MGRPLLVAVTRGWETALVTALGGSRTWEVARRCPDLADLLAGAAAGLAEVAVVSADLRLLDRSALTELAEAGVGVLGVYAPRDDAQERRLRQLGLSVVLPADSPLAALEQGLGTAHAGRYDALHAADAAGVDPEVVAGRRRTVSGSDAGPQSGEGHRAGTIHAVWGPTGAPGRSTIALNVAAELARQGRRTLLVDADPYGGTQAQALALLNEAPGLIAASRSADQGALDLPTLARLSPYVTTDLRILTGLPTASRWTELRPAPLRHVLSLARSLVDEIVIDCGFCLEEDEELSYDTRAPRRNAATVTSLRLADHVLVVGAADPIGLQRLVRALPELAEVSASAEPAVPGMSTAPADPSGAQCAKPARQTVVVNRVRASAVGPDPDDRIRSALARFADARDPWLIPHDGFVVDGALLAGQTLVEHAPSAEVRLAIASLAAAAVGMEVTAAPRRRRRGLV